MMHRLFTADGGLCIRVHKRDRMQPLCSKSLSPDAASRRVRSAIPEPVAPAVPVVVIAAPTDSAACKAVAEQLSDLIRPG
jgi:hypothetical protein